MDTVDVCTPDELAVRRGTIPPSASGRLGLRVRLRERVAGQQVRLGEGDYAIFVSSTGLTNIKVTP